MEFPEFAAVETIGSNCNKLGGLPIRNAVPL